MIALCLQLVLRAFRLGFFCPVCQLHFTSSLAATRLHVYIVGLSVIVLCSFWNMETRLMNELYLSGM